MGRDKYVNTNVQQIIAASEVCRGNGAHRRKWLDLPDGWETKGFPKGFYQGTTSMDLC